MHARPASSPIQLSNSHAPAAFAEPFFDPRGTSLREWSAKRRTSLHFGHIFMDTEWIGKKFDGKLIVKAVKNADHHYTGKHFQQGFFDLLGAENISAVLFSNAGTLAKFDSMGVAAGFAPPNDSNSVVGQVFSREINDTDYT